MMISGCDSAYPPSDTELAAEYAAGRRIWGGYFAGPNVLNGWSDADFVRVKAAGFTVIAFCSGWSDPVGARARGARLGVFVCLDDESGMRPDGPWVESWLYASGGGLYGNGSFHYNSHGIRAAAFHIFAGYYGYDPRLTWPGWDVRPLTPCGWQWYGSHNEYGGNVDSGWYDNSFLGAFGAKTGSLEVELLPEEHDDLVVHAWRFQQFLTGTADPGVETISDGSTIKSHIDYTVPTLPQIMAAIKAVGGGATLSAAQAQQLQDIHDRIVKDLAG